MICEQNSYMQYMQINIRYILKYELYFDIIN